MGVKNNPTKMFKLTTGIDSGAQHYFLDAIVCQYRSCRKVSPSQHEHIIILIQQ